MLDIKVIAGPGPTPSHPMPPIIDPRETEPRPEPIRELPGNPPAKEPLETPAPCRLISIRGEERFQHYLKDMKMTSKRHASRNFLLVAAAALSLGAISTPAAAAPRVDVQIGFGVPGIVVDARDPYYYSPNYCAGCWYGEWGGRTGYHRGGGRPWERRHSEADHHGHEHGRDVMHEGHR